MPDDSFDKVIDDATRWANQSLTTSLQRYATFVERAGAGTYTNDDWTKDVTAAMLQVQQDWARTLTFFSSLATALAATDSE